MKSEYTLNYERPITLFLKGILIVLPLVFVSESRRLWILFQYKNILQKFLAKNISNEPGLIEFDMSVSLWVQGIITNEAYNNRSGIRAKGNSG